MVKYSTEVRYLPSLGIVVEYLIIVSKIIGTVIKYRC